MKKILVLPAIMIGLTYCSMSFASVIIETAHNFSAVKNLILNDKDPQHTLLALDDDDTLTMMPCPSQTNCQYLGGPAWFTWQSGLPAGTSDRVYNNFNQLLDINNIIFGLSSMPIVESDIPAILQTAHDLKMPMVVTSARGYQMIAATEKQFSEDNILNVIEDSAVKTAKNKISYAGNYIPEGATRPVAYENGILYLAGQNKGLMLEDFLAKTGQTNNIHEIIFVDDATKNVSDVANAFANNSAVDVISVHYTYLEKHKADFLTGRDSKKLQAAANAQWFGILTALKENLPGLFI